MAYFYDEWGIIKRFFFCSGIYAFLVIFLLLAEYFNTRIDGLVALVFVINGVFVYIAIFVPMRQMKRNYIRFNQGYDPQAIFQNRISYTREEKVSLEKIERLLNNQEVNRLSNRQAQYLALQNQINPHFLYNTLEAIRGDALSEGMTSIADVTEALATFFRYTISNTDNLVSLEEELNNAENYFVIQNYRFGERIAMQIETAPGSEASRDYQVPKLTLQPIIENAIIHGLENKVGQGKVLIQIDANGTILVIRITDDGTGIPEAKLCEINHRLSLTEHMRGQEEKSRLGGIALANVNNRIQILFGTQYGLTISSILGFGTCVELRLPVKISATP